MAIMPRTAALVSRGLHCITVIVSALDDAAPAFAAGSHHRKHRYAPSAAPFSCAISPRAHIPTVKPMLSGGHDAAPFGAHTTLEDPRKHPLE
jgi:hypothetical protein